MSSTSNTSADSIGSNTSAGPSLVLNNDAGYKSNSTNNVNISYTDNGAVAGALNAVESVIKLVADVGRGIAGTGEKIAVSAIQSNEYVTTKTLETFTRVNESNNALINSVTTKAFNFGNDALNAASASAAQAGYVAEQALQQSRSVVDLTERLNDQNTYFLQDLNNKNSEFLGGVVETFTSTVSDIEEGRNAESGQVIKTIKELAETVQTGGESIQQGVNKFVTYGAFALIGFVMWRALS